MSPERSHGDSVTLPVSTRRLPWSVCSSTSPAIAVGRGLSEEPVPDTVSSSQPSATSKLRQGVPGRRLIQGMPFHVGTHQGSLQDTAVLYFA